LFTAGLLSRWLVPRYVKRCLAEPEQLIELGTPYREHAWLKVRDRVMDLLYDAGISTLLFTAHRKNLGRIERFIDKDLQSYYAKIS